MNFHDTENQPRAIQKLTIFSHKQIEILAKKNLEEIYILFDMEYEAQKKSDKLAHALSSVIPHVETLMLPTGDPADLLDEEAEKLILEIFN